MRNFSIPKESLFFYTTVLLPFLVLASLGIFNFNGFNYVNATRILELLFLLTSILVTVQFTRKRPALIIQAILIAYCSVSFCLAIFHSNTHLLDFIQAYKAFFYALLLCSFSGLNLYSIKSIKTLFFLILIVFFTKYSISVAGNWPLKPGVFTENNFELTLLFLLYLSIFEHLGRQKNISILLMSSVAILSGSLSGIAAWCTLYFFTSINKTNYRIIFQITFLGILFLLVMHELWGRLGNELSSIDRVLFLNIFINEVETWGVSNYLFGTFPLTPLLEQSCQQLSYYERLFSFSKNESCYSVILHSYLLRLIYDHGIIGLLALTLIYYRLLYDSHVQKSKIWGCFALALCSAVSVSSINSVYFSLGMIFLMSSGRNTK